MIMLGALLPLLHDGSLFIVILSLLSVGYNLLKWPLVLLLVLFDCMVAFIVEQLGPRTVLRRSCDGLLSLALTRFEGWTGGWAYLYI
jgi:hypothetical protein